MVSAALMAVVPPEFQIMVPAVVSFVTAALNVRVLLDVTVRVLVVIPVQSIAVETVTVPRLTLVEGLVLMVTLQVPRFARRLVILTVAVAGFAVGV